ncbi:MAG: MacS family sensor histidine kinase [Mycobacteriales bacterium]
MSDRPDPAAAVDAQPAVVNVWRALTAYRFGSLAYAVAVNVPRADDAPHPRVLVLAVAAMAVWSVLVTALYRRARGRAWTPATDAIFVADLAVAAASVLVTILVESPERIAHGEITVPTIWVSSAVLAWAVRWEWRGGLAAAVVVGLADFAEIGGYTFVTLHNAALMVLAGTVVGYAVGRVRRAEERHAEAVRLRAATAEREALARRVHDGVLQVLALVGRSSPDRRLAELAAEQERVLRAFLTVRPALGADGHGGPDGELDLAEALAAQAQRPGVQVAKPAGPVPLPGTVAIELAAAVGAALDNVNLHVGPDAPAWVLVEDTGDEIVVTVRDDGPGIPPGRLAEAEAEGRLGVAQSLRGRLRALGGEALVVSAPGAGTEVELRVPRR